MQRSLIWRAVTEINHGNYDKRVDAYIAKATPFAQPILRELRSIVHEGCPDVVETIKWGFPNFDHKGILCNMAAFKKHCTFGFWKSSLVVGEDGKSAEAHGLLGRMTSVKALPSRKVLLSYVRKATRLNDEGVKVERPLKTPKKALVVPAYLTVALKKNKKAFDFFEGFSPRQTARLCGVDYRSQDRCHACAAGRDLRASG